MSAAPRLTRAGRMQCQIPATVETHVTVAMKEIVVMKKNIIIDTIIDGGLIEPGQVVIVGLSGGPDSLCLLHALESISSSFNLTLVPVHINHMIRPEAEEEARHVADICERMDIECEMYEVDCPELAEKLGISTEEAGREVRYNIFDDVAEELEERGVKRERIVIALGHNADDQSETVLFRLLRGSGAHGLAGIPALRISEGGYTIVRPLLSVNRADIEEYIKDNKLRPNIDRSNDDNAYTRNKIRNELIPYLEKNYNPSIKETLRRFASLAYMDDSMISEIAFSIFESNMEIDDKSGDLTLNLAEIRDNPPAIITRIVRIIFSILGIENYLNYELTLDVMDAIYSEKPSGSLDLPDSYKAHREYDRLIFTTDASRRIEPDLGIEIETKLVMAKDFHPDETAPYAAFDFDKFNDDYPGRIGDLKLRTRCEGDFIAIRNGSKKIQDLLVDEKVIKNARDSIQMVAIDSEVLWILPNKNFSKERDREKGKYSQKYHISDTTERVLFIEISESI